MSRRIMECVPNFSEGRNPAVMDAIVEAISASGDAEGRGVKVLHTDRGYAANRTVITFAGDPEAVVEAAFRGAQKATELIDMRRHKGTHPRIGAVDVLPLVPVEGISLAECAEMARGLAERMYRELGIPCYCYEAAAFAPDRRNLANCRSGEYESLPEKIADPARRPDFSPDCYNDTVARTGASNVGARNFLIAVNFNLNTDSAAVAGEIACDVREKGRKLLDADGRPVTDGEGKPVWKRGPLKGCKAIGWFIEEYGVAQVSMNVTDIGQTPLHKAYEEVCRAAQRRGYKVTGTEIIGLVPLSVLVDAGRYFAAKEGAETLMDETAAVAKASETMGLSDLAPFAPARKVIEYLL